MPPPQRLAKVIARAGLCSRREAERWIEAGRVSVDGAIILSPALNVSDTQTITIDGKKLAKPERTRLWLYHKPRGLVTTHRDPEGRPTVFSALKNASLPDHILSIGRLDMDSEGLLLLTNDGEFARALEHPKNALARTYRVRVFGTPTEPQLARLKRGVTVEGVRYGSIDVHIERPLLRAQEREPAMSRAPMRGQQPEQGTNIKNHSGSNKKGPSNIWLVMTLHEGKNREIRNVMEHLGCKVSRLVRTEYGPFSLGALKLGEVHEMPFNRVKKLLEQVGGKE